MMKALLCGGDLPVFHNIPGLSITYNNCILLSYQCLSRCIDNNNFGQIIRYFHINKTHILFTCIFIHIGWRLCFECYIFIEIWNIRISLSFSDSYSTSPPCYHVDKWLSELQQHSQTHWQSFHISFQVSALILQSGPW